MRERDQASHRTKNGEGLDFEVGRALRDLTLIDSHQSIVLLVDIKILNDTMRQEIVE
jgi:hypothetical protein